MLHASRQYPNEEHHMHTLGTGGLSCSMPRTSQRKMHHTQAQQGVLFFIYLFFT
jgi:hypothetical protein